MLPWVVFLVTFRAVDGDIGTKLRSAVDIVNVISWVAFVGFRWCLARSPKATHSSSTHWAVEGVFATLLSQARPLPASVVITTYHCGLFWFECFNFPVSVCYLQCVHFLDRLCFKDQVCGESGQIPRHCHQQTHHTPMYSLRTLGCESFRFVYRRSRQISRHSHQQTDPTPSHCCL